MALQYVTHANDSPAVHALSILYHSGRCTRVLQMGDLADPYAVTLFTAPGAYDEYLCYEPCEFEARGIFMPTWAFKLPYLVALREFGKSDLFGLSHEHRSRLEEELHRMHVYFCRKFWRQNTRSLCA